mmetsp:Transcript_108555/g.188515  ORF Transcript_108555/g.188515 Transcript_108555/m.188515 type:complete len:186 (+) Transcript_108555:65-622(+)
MNNSSGEDRRCFQCQSPLLQEVSCAAFCHIECRTSSVHEKIALALSRWQESLKILIARGRRLCRHGKHIRQQSDDVAVNARAPILRKVEEDGRRPRVAADTQVCLKPCQHCNGSGSIVHTHGLLCVKKFCRSCGGSGCDTGKWQLCEAAQVSDSVYYDLDACIEDDWLLEDGWVHCEKSTMVPCC